MKSGLIPTHRVSDIFESNSFVYVAPKEMIEAQREKLPTINQNTINENTLKARVITGRISDIFVSFDNGNNNVVFFVPQDTSQETSISKEDEEQGSSPKKARVR